MFWENENAIAAIEELALLHRKKGNYAKAKNLYVCLVAMIKKANGPDSARLALNFFRLGEVYADEGNYQAAETYYKRAASIWEKTHPGSETNPFWFRDALRDMQTQTDAEDDISHPEQSEGVA